MRASRRQRRRDRFGRQQRLAGDVTPIVSNNCNYLRARPGDPVLIPWADARTLFHEFGHALHGLFSDVTYPSMSGTSVPTDYVEFPSQLLEQWLATPEKPEPYLQSTLYTKVVLALLTHRDAADILDTQRSEHLRSMRILTDRKRKGDLADQLICDHALFHLEADLRWLELTAARLDKLREAVAR